MRRHSWSGLVLVALLAVPVTVAVPAASGATAAVPARPSSGSFCTTMDHFLDFMRSAPRPSELRTPSGRTLLRDLRGTAPPAVSRPAKTLARSLEHVAAHGRHSLSAPQNAAANASLLATAHYAVDHCSMKRVTRAYASLLAAAQEAADAPAAPSRLRNARTDWN